MAALKAAGGNKYFPEYKQWKSSKQPPEYCLSNKD
jgi:hypothetical protein